MRTMIFWHDAAINDKGVAVECIRLQNGVHKPTMRASAGKLRAVQAKLRECNICEGQGFIEELSGSGCSVYGYRCSCPIGRFDDCLSPVRVAREFKRLTPVFRF